MRLAAVFMRGFSDGFGPTAPFVRSRHPAQLRLPSAESLIGLSVEECREVLNEFEQMSAKRHKIAMMGLAAGTVCFLLCIGALCLTVHLKHSILSVALFGILVAVPISSMVTDFISFRATGERRT